MREKILNLLENNGRIDIHDMSVMLESRRKKSRMR